MQNVGSPGFPGGFFHAYRWHPWGYYRPDDNIFYQALLVFTLQRVAPMLPAQEAARLQAIWEKITPHYALFRSVPGLQSYAFWQTRPRRRYFPNGHFFHRDEFFRPPDDADDTVLVYLTSPQPVEYVKWLREVKYPQHTNLRTRRIATTIEAWKNKPAYTTFFGENMPLGLDVSVLSNVLYWVFREGFDLTVHDYASMEIVADTLQRRLWATQPYLASPYYPYSSHILYNIARLLTAFDNDFTIELMPQALQAVEELLNSKELLSPIQQLKLEISLMRLNGKALPFDEEKMGWQEKDKDFSYFVLGLPTEHGNHLAQWLAPRRWLHLRFSCPAYQEAVLLEWLAVRENLSEK